MEKKEMKKVEKTVSKPVKEVQPEEKPKSAYTLFREKYPEGIGEIVNMRAVLR